MSHIWSGRLATCGSQPYQTAQLQKDSVVTEISRCSDLKSAPVLLAPPTPSFTVFALVLSAVTTPAYLMSLEHNRQVLTLGVFAFLSSGLCWNVSFSMRPTLTIQSSAANSPTHSILLLCSLSCYWNPCKYYTICLLKLFILNPSTMM